MALRRAVSLLYDLRVHDFRVLSDVEFEALVGDLLGADLGVHFERFRRAPDGGVDLRATKGGKHIVQCKHYVRSSFSDLKRDLKDELPSVERENPSTYRVATSHELTRLQVDELYEIFSRWMPDSSYVVGAESVDSLITKHPHVERRHYKLWLTSGQQLAAGINSSVFQRSHDLQEKIAEALPLYVESRALERASAVLDEERVCIISGPPGIGKTTLAKILLARAIRAGFEPIEVSHDIEEAWSTFDARSRQAFYYDDFLGRISLGERLQKNEDHRLTQFVDKVSKSKAKLLVLTTREYILAEARRTYEELARLRERMKIVVELEDYSRMEKARILYNHLWHSSLSPEDIYSILSDGLYLDIIDHPNFSPRLIEHITKGDQHQ